MDGRRLVSTGGFPWWRVWLSKEGGGGRVAADEQAGR